MHAGEGQRPLLTVFCVRHEDIRYSIYFIVEQPITNAPAAAAPEPTAAVAPQQASETPVILTDVSKAVQNRNYDDAVETLAKLKPLSAQMTDQQRIQYQQALVNTTEALARAKDKDPRAAAAYEKLSRSILGR